MDCRRALHGDVLAVVAGGEELAAAETGLGGAGVEDGLVVYAEFDGGGSDEGVEL